MRSAGVACRTPLPASIALEMPPNVSITPFGVPVLPDV
jgi:hypothetical protein